MSICKPVPMAFFFYYATQPLGLSGTALTGQISFLSPIISSAEVQIKETQRLTTKTITHPFFIQHQSPEGKGITSFMS